MACESTQLILIVLTSCLANSSISTSLFWRFPKPSWNIKLPLQLVPSAHPPHQVSILVSTERPVCSIQFPSLSFFFIESVYCYVPNLLPWFVCFQHNSLSSVPLLLDLLGLYHPSVLKFLCCSVIFLQRPSPFFQRDKQLLSCLLLALYSAPLPPSPNTRSPLASPRPGLHPTSTSSAPSLCWTCLAGILRLVVFHYKLFFPSFGSTTSAALLRRHTQLKFNRARRAKTEQK